MIFNEIDLNSFVINPFTKIGEDWFLITPTADKINPMTASWGTLGVLWHKNVATVFIRPSRYTFKLIEKTNYFSLSFFTEKYREVLNLCGSKSGRDCDKLKETGLTPIEHENYIIYKEAKITLCCRKIYFQHLNEKNFLDDSIFKNYPKNDYHTIFIGEIEKILKCSSD